MAKDLKYGHVTTEHGDIGENEPVVVFRAKDAMLPELLTRYWHLCSAAGSPDHHLDGIETAREQVMEWQAAHPTQVPQSAAQGPS